MASRSRCLLCSEGALRYVCRLEHKFSHDPDGRSTIQMAPPPNRIIASIGCLVSLASCSGKSSVSPTPSVDLTGTFVGSSSDSTGVAALTLVQTQSGNSISGSSAGLSSQGLQSRGTVSGTLVGTTLTFAVTVPVGGYSSPFQSCSATVQGTAQVSNSSIVGTYSGTHNCLGPVTNGQFTLLRQ
jgi:hypothetical protein